jgi:hypothetical protein
VFTAHERELVRERVLAKAAADPRVVAGAAVGSSAEGGDEWSDLDLAFGVRDGAEVGDVLDDWTRELDAELDAVHLFDLHSGPAIYRVFLLPGLLQMDLSFASAAEFRPRGPRFQLLFGEAGVPALAPAPSSTHLFGLAVHHALRARFSIERRRYWQAEYWIAQLRDHAAQLACLRLDLPAGYARGVDDLPAEVREPLAEALAGSLDPDELRGALAAGIAALRRESAAAGEVATRVEPILRALQTARL